MLEHFQISGANALWIIIIQIINGVLIYLMTTIVPEPYMVPFYIFPSKNKLIFLKDEIFHHDQMTQYLKGNFSYWNPKLTTPPGL